MIRDRGRIMENNYLYYYILSFFRKERTTNAAQLFHVFQGKRTPSMFYIIEKNRWHHGFSQFKRLTREEMNDIIEELEKEAYLEKSEKGYKITAKGNETQKNYFATHFYPKEISTFKNVNLRLPFWDRLQLFTQVFSEYSFHNVQYIPIIKHPKHQENVRQLFQQVNSSTQKENLLERWQKENYYIFQHLNKNTANTLANLLTGHGSVGKTASQMAALYQMENNEFYFYLLTCLEELLHLIKHERKKLPLLAEIVRQLEQETYLGLSSSTYTTYQLLEKGYSFADVASARKIKISTVREHILEMAFVFSNFPYQKYVPESIYQRLNQQFDTNKELTYKEAKTNLEDLEFIHFRLTELERLRSK